MLMALTDLDCSSRYHQSILKEYNHLKPIVFLSGSRLSSRCIFHTHHYLQPSQIRTFFRLMPTDRIGTFAPCQSGRWQANSKFDGRYDYIGSFQYSYSAVNRSDKAIMVYASGGTSILNKKVKDGDNCVNTWALAGQVNGSSVTEAGSANSNWSKSGSISFLVPSGSTWTVISDPLPSYGCSPGSFSVNVFTLS